MIKMTKGMLSSLSSAELHKYLTLIQDELKARRDLKIYETVCCLANAIQKVVDENLLLQEIQNNELFDIPNFIISNSLDYQKLYQIIPDYAEHESGADENYGYILKKWNDKSREWEKVN